MGRSGWPKEASILCRWDSGESTVYCSALICGDKAVFTPETVLGGSSVTGSPKHPGITTEAACAKIKPGVT